LYIMLLGHATPYIINKTKMGSKTYGINFVVAINHATAWATNDHLS
jgi:hypothetical protein